MEYVKSNNPIAKLRKDAGSLYTPPVLTHQPSGKDDGDRDSFVMPQIEVNQVAEESKEEQKQPLTIEEKNAKAFEERKKDKNWGKRVSKVPQGILRRDQTYLEDLQGSFLKVV